MKNDKNDAGNQAHGGWLRVIESEPPRFRCPVVDEQLISPCQTRGCPLWTYNPKSYNCVGAFSGMKAANSEERLQATSANQREKRGTLRAAADGKLSFYDLAYLYGLSRQRIEGFVTYGRQVMETLAPLFAQVDLTEDRAPRAATRRIGSPTLFTHTSPVSHINEDGSVTRLCIACESIIDPDDNELVLAILDKMEVAWCSRECNREFPIDAFLVSNRYKRHWANIALAQDQIDERSRVREITAERMEALRSLAKQQGY